MQDLLNVLTETHFPFANTMGYVAKITEILGGILLAAGLFTKIVTIPLMFSMAVVTYLMGNGNIFVSETSFLFLLLFLVFFLGGAGKWSLDYLFFDKKKIQA